MPSEVVQFVKPVEKKTHWVRIQFSEDLDSYLIDSSFKSGPKNMFIDGAIVQARLEQYMALLFQEAEDYRRSLRK